MTKRNTISIPKYLENQYKDLKNNIKLGLEGNLSNYSKFLIKNQLLANYTSPKLEKNLSTSQIFEYRNL